MWVIYKMSSSLASTNDESWIVTPNTINLRDNVAGGILLDFSIILSVSDAVSSETRGHFFFRFILEELSWDAENFVDSGVVHSTRRTDFL